MIVCLCRGVSDVELSATIRRGASSVEEVTSACGAGGDCGSCFDMIQGLVAATRGEGAASEGRESAQPFHDQQRA